MLGTDTLDMLESRLAARHGRKVSTIYSPAQINQHILETFELVGGVSRLARWANSSDDNYGEFLKLWIKVAPKGAIEDPAKGALVYQSMVPASSLNRAPEQAPSRDAVLIEQDDAPTSETDYADFSEVGPE
jgi:hypothetical protein